MCNSSRKRSISEISGNESHNHNCHHDHENGGKKKKRKPKCNVPGCANPALTSSKKTGLPGRCRAHGGGNRCQFEGGCTKSARDTDFCKKHGGGKRCQFEGGCTKSARDATDFCKKHGGGKRCQFEGCTKSAEGATDLCRKHGGGKRCQFEGCTKSAQGATNFCKKHGGGKRCQFEGCTKSARGATDFCATHGGGKRCQFEGCTKSAVGATDLCRKHGGGKRCQLCCTQLSNPNYGKFRHPDRPDIYICTDAAHALVRQANEKGNYDLSEELKKYFGFKKDLVVRAEAKCYYTINKLIPEIKSAFQLIVLDESVRYKVWGKAKSLSDKRPDYFLLNVYSNMALHIEFDENKDHEEDIDRLVWTAEHSGCGIERVYYIRLKAKIEQKELAWCKRRVVNKNVVYEMTAYGMKRLNEAVVPYIRECIERIKAGILPDHQDPASKDLDIMIFE